MIIRSICVLAEILVLFLLQTAVFPSIALARVVPNLILILVCAIAFMRGRIPAMLTGFIGGLLIDFCFQGFIGIYAFIFVVIGYLAGFTHKIYDEDDYTIPFILIGLGEIVFDILYFLFFYLLQGQTMLGYYLYRFMIPKVIYTVLVSLILYRLLNMLNVFLMRFDRE